LIGPRTFELASRYIVARPIDFLSGVNSRERHEIYEPLWPRRKAKTGTVGFGAIVFGTRRVLSRKRWAEAYSEFQKALGPTRKKSAVATVSRRLEPLALNLSEMPMRPA